MGETRQTRIQEFHIYNKTPVLGLREGSYIESNGKDHFLKGKLSARIFSAGKQPFEISEGALSI
jgi:dipeptidase E